MADFLGDGVLVAEGSRDVVPEITISLLDDVLDQAPGQLTVTLVDGWPDTPVTFSIDGVVVYTIDADTQGNLAATTVLVPDTVLAGAHTLTASQPGALSGSAPFTVLSDPAPVEEEPPVDAGPVPVPGAGHRWVLQDPWPGVGNRGTYVFTINPDRMSSPHRERPITGEHTSAHSGQWHIWEAGPRPVEWSFGGYCPTQEMHDQLVAWGKLNRRFWLTDHRGRTWAVTFVDVEMNARLRQLTSWANGVTDWGHDYTVSALIYFQAGEG